MQLLGARHQMNHPHSLVDREGESLHCTRTARYC